MSDGTAAGTRLLATGLGLDLELKNAAGRLFFSTRGGLWTSDGTSTGTVKIRALDFFPTGLKAVRRVLYFTSGRGQLWRSDGTTDGTVMLADIPPGFEMYDLTPSGLTKVGDRLAFRAITPELGMELWQSDGTSDGTTVLADVNPVAGSIPSYLRADGERLYFAADDGTHGNELFRTEDGVTSLVADINPYGDAYPSHLVEIDGIVYFSADDGSGHELWRTDGTPRGTRRVRDINPQGPSYPNALTDVGGVLYFRADDGEHGAELYRSDGTEAGTTRVADVNPSGSAFPRQLRDVGGALVFAADDGVHGEELWRSDGTPAGTRRLTDLHPTGSAFPRNLTVVGGTVFFTADDGVRRHDLWMLRACGADEDVPTCEVKRIVLRGGSVGDTRWQAFRVKDIVPGAAGSRPYGLAAFGDEVFFRAYDDAGAELWATDGTEAGTHRVADINPGPTGSFPYQLTAAGDALYFTADDGRGSELRVSDGHSVRLVIDLNPGDWGSYPHELTSLGDVLFFVADDGLRGATLWKTDGTAEGTMPVLADPYCPGDPRELTVFGGELLFTASCGGRSLWRTDGTPEGTRLVVKHMEIAPRFPTPFGDRLFVAGNRGRFGPEPFAWDGTTLGMVRDIAPNLGFRIRGSNPLEPCAIGDVVYFSADDQVHGRELWRSDGTEAGTVMVGDLARGAASSNPRRLTAVGNRLFFHANDGKSGWELWTSDGTAAGTRMVRDIDPTDTTAPSFFTPMGNLLFFSAQNPAFGRELWVTDGTEVGTRLAADVNPVRSAYPESIVELGGTLFFYADDGGSGEELWAPAACGNGVASPGEQCDDGNLESGDGCSAECRAEQTEPPPPQEGCTAERVCVEGSRLHVRGRSTLGVRVWIRGEGIVPPAPRNPLAPGLGGAMLEVTNPVTGEAMHLSLPAEGWKPRTFRAGMGFRYEGNRLTGCARVDLMPGAIRARCRRPAAELTLDEPSQTQLVVKLHLGPETRYCAAFGGEVERDCGIRDARHGVFLARAAPAPTSCE